jgi:hypothetical protein
VLELGSGCGLVGLTAATLGAHVTMTDLGEVIPRLHENIAAFVAGSSSSSPCSSSSVWPKCGRVDAMELDWTDETALRRVGTETEWDVILASDVMYSDTVFRLFFHALATSLAPPEGKEGKPKAARRPSVKVLVGHKQRCVEERGYFDAIRQAFHVTLLGRAFSTNVYLWQAKTT